MCTSELLSQTNEEQILAIREASNLALKSHNEEVVLSYLTDYVLTTTGNGNLLSGKKALEKYILDGGKSKIYLVRETKELIVNEKIGLAWETGIWNGYQPEKSDESLVNGKYSAMWIKTSNVWKIKSHLFVTLGLK
ncbi:nuclear transport factor 2 family protein [Psychroserpens burtonensis]|uniref:Nuclear transport factor 2 family protein n=1 Tax=Psychroserpens burtonensis TaxID=49278 RepID=A0A5C7B728_9FLAO|nr:nuclear transport factor 2 family protein [Psychroserpens burtonensis]TXE16449.1 nuclear transport factor 2 family protein [Psychroserpens burtonensis]